MGVSTLTIEQAPLAERNPLAGRRQRKTGVWREYPLNVEELLRVELGLRLIQRDGPNEVKACCPFHNDRNPSFSISLTKPGYPFQCWSCGERGNAVSLVKQVLGCSASAALQVLNRYGANFSLRPRYRPKSRNNWRGSGRKPDLQARRLVQRRCINRMLATGPKKRSELLEALEREADLKRSTAYSYITSLIKQRHLVIDRETKLVHLTSSYDFARVLASPSNSNRKGDGNLEVQSEDESFTVTWGKTGHGYGPIITYKRSCLHCGEQVRGKKTKLYCSENCRKRAWRVKQSKPKLEWDERMSALENVNRIFSDDFKQWAETKQRNAQDRRERREAREANRAKVREELAKSWDGRI